MVVTWRYMALHGVTGRLLQHGRRRRVRSRSAALRLNHVRGLPHLRRRGAGPVSCPSPTRRARATEREHFQPALRTRSWSPQRGAHGSLTVPRGVPQHPQQLRDGRCAGVRRAYRHRPLDHLLVPAQLCRAARGRPLPCQRLVRRSPPTTAHPRPRRAQCPPARARLVRQRLPLSSFAAARRRGPTCTWRRRCC